MKSDAATAPATARADFAAAIKDAAIAALIALGVTLPLIGFRTDQGPDYKLILTTRFDLVAVLVGVVFVARLLFTLWSGRRPRAAKPPAVLERLRAIIRRKREALGRVPMAYVSIKISPARFALMHRIAYTNRILERELGAGGEVRFVDITRRMIGRGIGPLLGYYSEDPLHMNRDGYRVLGRSLAEYLTEVERQAGDLRVRRVTAVPAWMAQDSIEEADEKAAANTAPQSSACG
ncbi:MAG: DUF3382 domain-containing protein [Bacteroidales bacterium]|nr:DUF3382 domain-containing protein [Bacteroidales bacterium]